MAHASWGAQLSPRTPFAAPSPAPRQPQPPHQNMISSSLNGRLSRCRREMAAARSPPLAYSITMLSRGPCCGWFWGCARKGRCERTKLEDRAVYARYRALAGPRCAGLKCGVRGEGGGPGAVVPYWPLYWYTAAAKETCAKVRHDPAGAGLS